MKEIDEGVRYRRTIFARVELIGESVKREGVLAKEGNIEDCFCMRKVESGEVGVKASFW